MRKDAGVAVGGPVVGPAVAVARLSEEGLNIGIELLFAIGLFNRLDDSMLFGVEGFMLNPVLFVESASGDGDATPPLLLSSNEFICLLELFGLIPMDRLFLVDSSMQRLVNSLVVFCGVPL